MLIHISFEPIKSSRLVFFFLTEEATSIRHLSMYSPKKLSVYHQCEVSRPVRIPKSVLYTNISYMNQTLSPFCDEPMNTLKELT